MRRSPDRRGTRPPWRILLILACAAIFEPVCVGANAGEPAWEEQVLMIEVNGVTFEEMLLLLRDSGGGYWLDAKDLDRLRLSRPATPVREFDGRQYYALGAITGLQASLDPVKGVLHLQVPAEAFRTQTLKATGAGPDPLIATATGLFANYDLYLQHSGQLSAGSAFAEVGLFSGFGVLTNTSVLRRADRATGHVRLDTLFTRDFPDTLQTLQVGDTFTDPGTWGSALRFGGVRFARNFDIRPDLVTTPMLTASGSAVVPSTVDVFINNQKVMSQDVQPGPFSIDQLPAVSGSGDVNLVVRDALGREIVISQAFYSSPVMLAKGLSQYSISAGSLRENYTLSSFHYGSFVASGNLRRGVTDRVTLAGHVEALRGAGSAAGIDMATLFGNYGVATAALAIGGDSMRSGWLAGTGFEHRGPRGGFALGLQYASEGFRRAADIDDSNYRTRLRGIAQASWSFGRAGSASIALARRELWGGEGDNTISIAHNMQLGRGALSLSLTRLTGTDPQTMGYLNYTMAFGHLRSFDTTAEAVRSPAEDRSELRAAMMQSAPVGEGSGWRVSAATNGNYDGWWLQRFRAADLELRAARNYGTSGQSVQLRGGVTVVEGMVQASRQLDGSFAVVDVSDIADVPVYVENQLVARTNENGHALLPNLLPYGINRVSIDPQDLPLNTSIDSRRMEIRPAFRSGVIARFPVERTSPATFELLQQDGSPVPTGAAVRFNGEATSVALAGVTFVTRLDRPAAGTAEWPSGRCEFRIQPVESADPLPDLGKVVCVATPTAQP